MRYDCLFNLLRSIQKYYPKVRVIVADDNPSEVYKQVSETEFPMVKLSSPHFDYSQTPLRAHFRGYTRVGERVGDKMLSW